MEVETVRSMPIGLELLLTAGKVARDIAAQRIENGIDVTTGAIDYAAVITANVADNARRGAAAVFHLIHP